MHNIQRLFRKKSPYSKQMAEWAAAPSQKLHHWDRAKVLLYRWPRLMSSVCASLMFAASRVQTASHRVRSNEDDNGTRNMAGRGYVNHRRLVTGLFIAAFICKKKSEKLPHLKNRINTSSIPPHPHPPPAFCTIVLAHVNIKPLSLLRLYLW